MGKEEFYQQLVHLYVTNQASEEELELFFRLLETSEINDMLQSYLDTEAANMLASETKEPTRKTRLSYRIAVAASILLCLSFGAWFMLHRYNLQQTSRLSSTALLPGGNKAVLFLASGQQIILTNAKNGLLANQGSTKINKTADGQIVYDAKQSESSQIVYNTLTTPRGGQYHLILADGSNVWLNAASSIKYPTAFTGKNRQVEITGEVYFEVAHNAAKPFRVISNSQIVEVLGTHFNINAYSDEPTLTTTLVEGSIKISKATHQVILLPGQQAQILASDNESKISIVDNSDTEQAIAWHQGLFRFHNANIQTVMRQLCRWYNVEVRYEGEIPRREFSGEITRNVNASQILDILNYFKVQFRIEQGKNGKIVFITP